MEIRALRRSDNRANFRSGSAAVDEAFQVYSGVLPNFTGLPFVALADRRILAFAEVAPAVVEIEGQVLAVFRVARFSVDRSARGQGVGAHLLKMLIRLAYYKKKAALVVDSAYDTQDYFQAYGFRPLPVLSGSSLARPRAIPMILSMRALDDLFPKRNRDTPG